MLKDLIKELVIFDTNNLCLYYDKDNDSFDVYYKEYGMICPYSLLKITNSDFVKGQKKLEYLLNCIRNDTHIDTYSIGKYIITIMKHYNGKYLADIVINDICEKYKEVARFEISLSNKRFTVNHCDTIISSDGVEIRSISEKLFSSDDDDDENALY